MRVVNFPIKWRFAVAAGVTLIGACSQRDADPQVHATVQEVRSAQLVDFDSQGREPGGYLVELRARAEMEVALQGGQKAEVLPELIPRSRRDLTVLAEAMAATVNARVAFVTFGDTRMLFGLENASEDLVRSKLASDPRIRAISAAVKAAPLP